MSLPDESRDSTLIPTWSVGNNVLVNGHNFIPEFGKNGAEKIVQLSSDLSDERAARKTALLCRIVWLFISVASSCPNE